MRTLFLVWLGRMYTAVLCPAAVLGRSVPGCAVPCCTVLCYAVLYTLQYAMLCHFVPCHFAVCCAELCCAVLCCAVLCYDAVCLAMLMLLFVCTDDSDDEQEAKERMPSSRISTSMVNQATAHLHRHGRCHITLTSSPILLPDCTIMPCIIHPWTPQTGIITLVTAFQL